jgi:hypothetical protein
MSTRRTCLLAFVAILCLVAPAAAQHPAGSIGVFFDAAGTMTSTSVPAPFILFNVYVIGFRVPGGMLGYEFSVGMPAGTIVSGGRQFFPAGALDVGTGDDNWLVGTGGTCLEESVAAQIMVQYNGALFLAQPGANVQICLGGATPSSVGGIPGYVTCLSPNDFRTFGPAYVDCAGQAACALLNPSGAPSSCPGIEIAFGNRSAVPGAVVDIPVTLSQVQLPKGNLNDLSGLDLSIHWNGSIATLESVTVAPATSNWLMQYFPGQDSTRVSMASLSGISVPASGVVVLIVRLRAGNNSGQTAVTATSARAFDGNRQPIAFRTVAGSLVVQQCDRGDLVDDNEVNSADAILALEIGAGEYTPSPVEQCAGDMNGDGIVNSGDAVLILRRAVGLAKPAVVAAAPARLDVAPGDALGEVLLNYQGTAGLEAMVDYDESGLQFMRATAPGTGGLAVANGKDPGRVKIAFAKATAGSGTIRLQFDVKAGGGAVRLTDSHAFDEAGDPQGIKLGTAALNISATAVPGNIAMDSRVQLLPAQPNPFNPSTLLRFQLGSRGDAVLRILDTAGRQVRSLTLSGLERGEHSVLWDGRNESGSVVASGNYLVHLEALGQTHVGRVTLVK